MHYLADNMTYKDPNAAASFYELDFNATNWTDATQLDGEPTEFPSAKNYSDKYTAKVANISQASSTENTAVH